MSSEMFEGIAEAIEKRSPELLVFDDVDLKDFAALRQRLRGPSSGWEGFSFRIHWYYRERVLKIVMPSKMHECIGAWINATISRASRRGLIPDTWEDTMQVMNAPEHDNFVGDYEGCVKEADVTFVPFIGSNWTKPAKFPSVVLESGWSESNTELREDVRLWQMGSEMAVRVVLLAKFYPVDQSNRIRFVFSIFRCHPDGRPSLHDRYQIFPPPPIPHQNPTISFDEFYTGNCPPGINAGTEIPLDLVRLGACAAVWIGERGCVPA
ncbi:hypothetical protein HOY82DRAFT_670912 [Tuber indicum]|nr:hypothetical protein HOY82DRAFT_670912 [Tuber indicum]